MAIYTQSINWEGWWLNTLSTNKTNSIRTQCMNSILAIHTQKKMWYIECDILRDIELLRDIHIYFERLGYIKRHWERLRLRDFERYGDWETLRGTEFERHWDTSRLRDIKRHWDWDTLRDNERHWDSLRLRGMDIERH